MSMRRCRIVLIDSCTTAPTVWKLGVISGHSIQPTRQEGADEMLLTGKAHYLEVLTASLDFLGISGHGLFMVVTKSSFSQNSHLKPQL